jgi:molybdopterin-guanine dinucleotide biosynthesis protein A
MPEKAEKQLPLTAVIMSGGRGRRLGGIDKPLITIGGQRLIDRTFQIVSHCCQEVLISSNNPQLYREFPATTIPDLYPHHGALGGMYSCLRQASFPYVLILAGDMPFISAAAIHYLWSRHEGYDVILPKSSDGHQPLHAIYNKNCMEKIKKQLDCGKLKISGFFSEVRVLEIPTEQHPSGFGPRYFFNLNTPEDINQARQLAKQ